MERRSKKRYILTIAATLVALVSFAPTPSVSAQEYPVVKEFQLPGFMEALDLTEYFVNGASPIGNIDLERNCRPSDRERELLHNSNGRLLFSPIPRLVSSDGSVYGGFLYESGERQRIVNRYFSCIGIRQFEEPEEFGCSSIGALFGYLEMFQPNHPHPDRVPWSEMDHELYSALYYLGERIKSHDEVGLMGQRYGMRWTFCM